jgi:hypothetical protein
VLSIRAALELIRPKKAKPEQQGGGENSQEKSNTATITVTAVLVWLQTATAGEKRQVAVALAQDTATIRKILPAKAIPVKATPKQIFEKAMGLLTPDGAPVVH